MHNKTSINRKNNNEISGGMSFYEASIYTPPASRQGIHRGWLEERRRERERERDGGEERKLEWREEEKVYLGGLL